MNHDRLGDGQIQMQRRMSGQQDLPVVVGMRGTMLSVLPASWRQVGVHIHTSMATHVRLTQNHLVFHELGRIHMLPKCTSIFICFWVSYNLLPS